MEQAAGRNFDKKMCLQGRITIGRRWGKLRLLNQPKISYIGIMGASWPGDIFIFL